jgi:hypothetical protein
MRWRKKGLAFGGPRSALRDPQSVETVIDVGALYLAPSNWCW